MLKNARYFVLLLCLINLIPVWAAEGDDLDTQITEQGQDELGTGMVRMIVSLLAILSLIAAGVFVLKKITPYRGLMSGGERHIAVLSKTPLGQRRAIYLVRIANEILVVGLTNANISLLTKMDADEYYGEQGAPLYENPNDYTQSFRSILGKLGIRNSRTSAAHEEKT